MVDGMENAVQKLYDMAPGGFLKVAFDEKLTILDATKQFDILIHNKVASSNAAEEKGLLDVVYSADVIYVNKQIAAQKSTIKKGVSLDFRILRPDGSFKWIMISGSLNGETSAKGAPVFACIAVDITGQKEKQKELEEKNRYQRITSDLARDINFEYSIAKDILQFAELFHEVFGLEAKITGFREKLEKTKVIHPDELAGVKKIYNSMMAGKKQTIFELRLLPKQQTEIRYRCYASIISDENRNPVKIVGRLSLVPEAKKVKETAPAAKPVKVTLDVKSGLPDVASTIALISDSMRKQPENDCSALLVIEPGGYQGLNYIYGSINGKSMIAELISELRECTRTDDIVGMISADSFVVMLKGIPSAETAFHVAEDICKNFDEKFHLEYMSMCPRLYIGMDFIKGQKGIYETYISNALIALENAKKATVSNYQVFYTV